MELNVVIQVLPLGEFEIFELGVFEVEIFIEINTVMKNLTTLGVQIAPK